MIEAALIGYLSSQPGIAGQVYYVAAPPSARLPFAVVSLTAADLDRPRASPGIRYQEFDIECYAKNMVAALTLASTVRGSLEGFTGDMVGVQVTLSRITQEFDGDEPQSGSVYRSMKLQINYR